MAKSRGSIGADASRDAAREARSNMARSDVAARRFERAQTHRWREPWRPDRGIKR